MVQSGFAAVDIKIIRPYLEMNVECAKNSYRITSLVFKLTMIQVLFGGNAVNVSLKTM